MTGTDGNGERRDAAEREGDDSRGDGDDPERRDREDRRDRLTGIAHDLRSPLRAANVSLARAREDCESPALDDLAATHERLLELVDDLDDLAAAGRPVDDGTAVSIADAARDAWRTAATDDAALRVESNAVVRGDERRVRRLLENLLANAVRHGGDDVTVTVGALAESGTDGFYVADDGPGVPPEERDAVFERGYTTDDEGTGYGLAIVAELAAAHGWRVAVTESETDGARFEVRTA